MLNCGASARPSLRACFSADVSPPRKPFGSGVTIVVLRRKSWALAPEAEGPEPRIPPKYPRLNRRKYSFPGPKELEAEEDLAIPHPRVRPLWKRGLLIGEG